MPFLLRNLTKPKWVRPDWMDDADIPADALTDLRSDHNELSVWAVDPDGPDLNRALTAFASARSQLDKLDYALIDEDIATSISIMVNPSEAATRILQQIDYTEVCAS